MVDDNERVQKLVDMLGRRKYQVDGNASQLLLHYMQEIGQAIVEQSMAVAIHRTGSKTQYTVTVEDVQIVLLKKYGVRIPGASPALMLHKDRIRGDAANSGEYALSEDAELTEMRRREDALEQREKQKKAAAKAANKAGKTVGRRRKKKKT